MMNDKLEIKKRLFGTDGIRARANTYPMSAEVILALGKAVAIVLGSLQEKRRVIIGKDTRISCYMFENALIAGLNSMGADTLMVGPLPSPGVSFITRAYRADAGIVISASHNPYYDNGIKIFSYDGFKLPDFKEEEIELIMQNNLQDCFPRDDYLGKNKRIVDADGRYIEFIKATFSKRKTLKGVKIVLDCANGAAYKIAPAVFFELDAEVVVLNDTPNGININNNCGALFPEVVQKVVIENKADVGIALDGDGDRVIMTDEKGHIVDGDTILAICALNLKRKGALENNRVVATVMTNLGVVQLLRDNGIEVILSKVGDRYVIQDMLKNKAMLGGEQSGHLIFLDYNTTGDGLVAALQVLKIMIETESTLSDLASVVVKYPQTLINIRVSNKPSIQEIPYLQDVIDKTENILEGNGRVLVRYSGTENICRIMVEGPKQHQVDILAKDIAKIIEDSIGIVNNDN